MTAPPRSFFSEGENEVPATVGEQPLLFSLPEDVEDRMEREGIYSGERLRRQKPEIYAAIVALLGERQSIRAIKRVCGVHHYTIAAVAAAERIAIDTSRESAVAGLRFLRALLIESMTDLVMEGKLKSGEHAFALIAATDKAELLDGNATVRIETGTTGDAPRSFDEMFGRMKRVKMGSVGMEDGQCAEVAAVRIHSLGSESVDIKAPDLQCADVSAVDTAGAADGDMDRGGGGSIAAGVPDAPTH